MWDSRRIAIHISSLQWTINIKSIKIFIKQSINHFVKEFGDDLESTLLEKLLDIIINLLEFLTFICLKIIQSLLLQNFEIFLVSHIKFTQYDKYLGHYLITFNVKHMILFWMLESIKYFSLSTSHAVISLCFVLLILWYRGICRDYQLRDTCPLKSSSRYKIHFLHPSHLHISVVFESFISPLID